jgi:hypothetical protein
MATESNTTAAPAAATAVFQRAEGYYRATKNGCLGPFSTEAEAVHASIEGIDKTPVDFEPYLGTDGVGYLFRNERARESGPFTTAAVAAEAATAAWNSYAIAEVEGQEYYLACRDAAREAAAMREAMATLTATDFAFIAGVLRLYQGDSDLRRLTASEPGKAWFADHAATADRLAALFEKVRS